MRQVVTYAESMETSPYPRLFTLDFLTKEDCDTIRPMLPQTTPGEPEQIDAKVKLLTLIIF